MTGDQLAKIRHALCGTDTATFGLALGIGGKPNVRSVGVRRLESMKRDIPEWYAILARHYYKHPVLWREFMAR